MASRTLHAYVGAALGESDAVPGVISLAQSFGSLAHWHPHLHLIVTDGAFWRDGSFVAITVHDAAVLAEAWRRAGLELFVRQSWLEEDAAAAPRRAVAARAADLRRPGAGLRESRPRAARSDSSGSRPRAPCARMAPRRAAARERGRAKAPRGGASHSRTDAHPGGGHEPSRGRPFAQGP